MPKVQPLSPDRLARTLDVRLARVADRIRQVATNLGARPMRLFLVWTYSGGYERGQGEEEEVARVEVLPTPSVADLSTLTRNSYAAGVYPLGAVRVTEVSTRRFTRDVLTGRRVPLPVDDSSPPRFGGLDVFVSPVSGERVEKERVSFFYELVDDGRHADGPPPRQRFRLYGEPHHDAESVQWVLVLERISEERARDGRTQEGVDPDQAESPS